MTSAHRAVWTFLIYALVAPFLAALAIALVLALISVLGVGHLIMPEGPPPVGAAALAVFVWAILPAVLTALALAGLVWRGGGFSWIAAAAAGVIAFAVASIIFPFGLEDARPYLAFLSGLIAIAVREVLMRAGIALP